ncbi:hypothetical protein DFH08DRAFT_817955 [Mycena albidolilacea]|uniref:Uncharacterized protein n=1 Tax=Mycena albidolilacea TaxID=1033008 RepID=A0AAD7EGW9_9AGAR|nr:hypothetical protein DFH08DRAFT_817955 [Mycena albidolilacea]
MGLNHLSTKTYKSNYGCEVANLDVVGSVMCKNVVRHDDLNEFKALAIQPGTSILDCIHQGITVGNIVLAKLPTAYMSISIAEHLKKGYPNHPELIAVHLEHKHLSTIHQSLQNKKLSSIRALLVAANKDMQPSSHQYDMQEVQNTQLAQFSEPSVLTDIAMQYAPLAKLAKMSASSSPSTSCQNKDIVINKTTTASTISLDNI